MHHHHFGLFTDLYCIDLTSMIATGAKRCDESSIIILTIISIAYKMGATQSGGSTLTLNIGTSFRSQSSFQSIFVDPRFAPFRSMIRSACSIVNFAVTCSHLFVGNRCEKCPINLSNTASDPQTQSLQRACKRSYPLWRQCRLYPSELR